MLRTRALPHRPAPQRARSYTTSINVGQRPVINVATVHSKITSNDLALLQALQAKFTFQDPKFKFLKKFRAGNLHWDGRVEFLKRRGADCVFLTGLLPEVTKKLDEMDIQVDIYDHRQFPEEDLSDAVKADTLAKGGIKLHDYQLEIANVALTQRHGIVKCATGGGKTVIFAAMLKALEKKNYPSLLLFRNKTLVTQTYDLLRKCGIEGIGRVNMDYNEPSHITCATLQSISKVGALNRFKMLIVDEVHEFGSTKSIATLRTLNNTVWRLGFSATPFKENNDIRNMHLKGIFGPLLCDITTETLTNRNILADAQVRIYKITEPSGIRFLQPWSAAEEAGIVMNEAFNRKVVDIVNSVSEGRIMILVRRLAHGDALSKLLPDAYWIQGQDSTETREFVLSQLRENKAGRKKVVAIVSAIGYIGLNVYVHHLINCTGGKDANSTIQKLGRGLRKAPDKESVVYHDFQFENNIFLKAHSTARIKTLEQEGHPITYV